MEARLGPIDVWVNVAMTSVFAFVKDTTSAEFKRVTEVCYLGYVNGTLAALKRVLLRESQVQPVLVVFEDLHWIDTETQEVELQCRGVSMWMWCPPITNENELPA